MPLALADSGIRPADVVILSMPRHPLDEAHTAPDHSLVKCMRVLSHDERFRWLHFFSRFLSSRVEYPQTELFEAPAEWNLRGHDCCGGKQPHQWVFPAREIVSKLMFPMRPRLNHSDGCWILHGRLSFPTALDYHASAIGMFEDSRRLTRYCCSLT